MSMQEASYRARLTQCLYQIATATRLEDETGIPAGRTIRTAEAEERRIMRECSQALGGKRARHIHADALARAYRGL